MLGVAVLLPLIFGFWYSPAIAMLLFTLASVIMCLEFGRITGLKGLSLWMVIVSGLCLVILPLLLHAGETLVMPAIGFDLIVGIIVFCLLYIRDKGTYPAIFGFVLMMCIGTGAKLLMLPAGPLLLLSLALIIACCDIMAFFVGRSVGGPKLAPAISPNKTISGAVGGLSAALVASIVLAISHNQYDIFEMVELVETPVVYIAVIIGLVVGVLAQAGDLMESLLKRKFGVKDSGQIIPGHGGLLDRFDGYLLTLPVVYLAFMLA